MKRPKKVVVYKTVTFTKAGEVQGLEGSKSLPLNHALDAIERGWAVGEEDTEAPAKAPAKPAAVKAKKKK